MDTTQEAFEKKLINTQGLGSEKSHFSIDFFSKHKACKISNWEDFIEKTTINFQSYRLYTSSEK